MASTITGLLYVMEGLKVSDPPKVIFILLCIKKVQCLQFFSLHVKSPTLL